MSRSPRPSKKREFRKLARKTVMDSKDILKELEDTQITARPADEAVKMHLDTGCSWIQPQFPEDT